jgi:photosystem II stability/assembly factor-like uncharacterized protein
MHQPTNKAAAILALMILTCNVMMNERAAAQWLLQSSGTTERLRAVSAVSRWVAWASGNRGTCVRTTNGGKTWQALRVPGADSLDFRDVEAFGDNTAYLLSIGEGERSRIYKTTDGGSHWTMQFMNRNSKAFFDAFAFWDANNGIAVSDAVEGHLVIIKTTNGGATWMEILSKKIPSALPGEGAFAASGTSITVQGRNRVWIGTGVKTARVYRSIDGGNTWTVSQTPILSDNESSGIFSVAFKDTENGVIVGGDYRREAEARQNAATSNDGGRTWKVVIASPPAGFRSAVVFVPGTAAPTLIAVGPSGSDYSVDNGATWKGLGTEGFHAVSFAGRENAGWAVGESGRIAKLVGRVPDEQRSFLK